MNNDSKNFFERLEEFVKNSKDDFNVRSRGINISVLDNNDKNMKIKSKDDSDIAVKNLTIYSPCRKEIENGNGIKIKCAGFNLACDAKARKVIKDFLENIGIKNTIDKGIDIEKFKKTKAKYKEAKENFNNKIKEFSKFIQICCKCLKVENNSELGLTVKLEKFIKDLKENKFNECEVEDEKGNSKKINVETTIREFKSDTFKSNIKKLIEGIIRAFESKIEQLRDILSRRTDAQVKHYRFFSEKLQTCINEIDKIKNVSSDLRNALERIKSGMKLEYEYLLTKDKRGKENKLLSNKFINSEDKYNNLKHFLKISDYYAEDEIKEGEYKNIIDKNGIFSFNKQTILEQIFGKNINKKENWQPDIDDIKQGAIGNCYLLSALQTLCNTESGRTKIKDCFVNFDNICKDQYVKFEFYKLKFKWDCQNNNNNIIAKGNEKVTIIVDNTFLNLKRGWWNFAVGNQSGKLWVNLFEKAFAAYMRDESNFDITDQSCSLIKDTIKKWISKYAAGFSQINLDAGKPFIPLAAINGESSYRQIYNNTAKDDDVVQLKVGDNIGFKELPECLSNYGLETSHAYSVLSIDNESIEIKNPHNKLPYYDLSKLKNDNNEVFTLNNVDDNILKKFKNRIIIKNGKKGIIRLHPKQIITKILGKYAQSIK